MPCNCHIWRMPLQLKQEKKEDSRGFRGCGGPLYSFELAWPTKPKTGNYVDSSMNMMKVTRDLYALSMTLRAVEWLGHTACISDGAGLTVDDITYLAAQFCTYLILGQGSIYTTSYMYKFLSCARSNWELYGSNIVGPPVRTKLFNTWSVY